MSSDIKRLVVFRAFQIWELLVFCAALSAGLQALHLAGAAEVTAYVHPVFLAGFAVLTLLWHVLIGTMGLYSSRRLVSRINEIAGATGAVAVAAGFLALLGALSGVPTNEAPFLVWFMLTGSGLMVSGRIFARLFLRAARARGCNLRFVTIVGANAEAQTLARELLSSPSSGFRLTAFFDTPDGLAELPPELGPGRDIAELAHHLTFEPVDEVLIALPLDTPHKAVIAVVDQCRRVGVSARVIWGQPGGCDLRPSALEVVGASRASLVFAHAPSWGWSGRAKTAMDVTVATITLLAIAPLLAVVALAIRLDSPGPVFFVQSRVGRNKQPFGMIKFRTMVADAEARQAALEVRNEAAGPVFKIQGDPRITRVGAILRRYSIDELPQLFNVVRGEMSLVGPRPLPLRDVSLFEKDWYSRRFSVKPGLTCSWVLAGRSQLEFDSWVAMDLDYIDNWSLGRDVMICLRTIPAVLRGQGAY